MWVQLALLSAQMFLGEITRPRPHKVTFDEFLKSNAPSEIRPVAYVAGTMEVTPSRIWYGDFKQRAVERDSHWTDYLFFGAMGALLDFITVGYRYYCGECFALCYGTDANVERVTIGERLAYSSLVDNAGGGFLIDDPQAWGGDQPPGEGGQYSWCDITRGNYTDPTNAYLESLLTTPPNKTPALRGVSLLISRGPSGFTESGYFAAGGIGFTPRFKEWKVVIRRQPNNLVTDYSQIGRHANPMEVIYEHATSLEYGARVPVSELNLASWRAAAQTLHTEGLGWSGKIENPTSPLEVVQNVLAQVDGVLDPSPSLGLTMRLIRRDYSFGSLRTMDRSVITAVRHFNPGAYEDSVNKIIVNVTDMDNEFQPRPALYIDPANQTVQDGRIVPQTQDYLGVGDMAVGNQLATRDGRALAIPRAPLECDVKPSFGRLSYRGEVVKFQWGSPTFTKLMRTLKVTPSSPWETDYSLVLIEDQFASGLRTFGEPVGTGHTDPAAGLDVAPPSAAWDAAGYPPDGLIETLILQFTEYEQVITGGIIFGAYAPGGQYARIYVTEPGGAQTLSPIHLAPDTNNKATFNWPALAVGTYQFCVETYSLHNVTNGVKVCATIDVVDIGSPSVSPSASVSPSVSPSSSTSPSASSSPSLSPSASTSLSASPSGSQSPSASSSPSASISPSPSVSPSSSDSPSAAPVTLTSEVVQITGADHESGSGYKWPVQAPSPGLASGVTGAHGVVYNTSTAQGAVDLTANEQDVAARCRIRPVSDASTDLVIMLRDGTTNQVAFRLLGANGQFQLVRNVSTQLAISGNNRWVEGNWYTMELRAHIADSPNGTIEGSIWDDSGTLMETISASGVDTQNTANAFVNRVHFGGLNSQAYIDNTSIEVTGATFGPCRVETLLPTGAGDLADHTRGGADSGANWSQCEENPDNGDTDYVESTGVNQDDSYAFSDRVIAGDVLAVQVNAIAKFASAGTREIQMIVRISGVTFVGAITHTLATNYRAYWEVWNNNPATGTQWTDSEINAAQFGVRSLTDDCRITQVAVEVLVQL